MAKLLAERLKEVLPGLVGERQTAFIQGRQIPDEIMIANESIVWAKRMKKQMLLLKVDFIKAFDVVSCNYLDTTLNRINFGVTWRNWIKGCLTSARVSVLVNDGSTSDEFSMERGLRQGDPLSPFPFILAGEPLNVMMVSGLPTAIPATVGGI